MSQSCKLSLLRLETQSRLSDQKPLIEKKNSFVYPASPSLIKKHLPELYDSYMKLRNEKLKYSGKIYDERLRPYQNEDVDFLVNTVNKANFNQQRLGKTPETLVTLKHSTYNKILIIAPKSTLYAWANECVCWLEKPAHVVRGPKNQRIKAYEEHNVFVCTYQMAKLDIDIMPQFDIIVIDEAHRLRNFKGQRSKSSPAFAKAIMQLGYKAKQRMVLTGTPSPNYSNQIFPLLHFLFPTLFTSFWNFAEYYYEVKDTQYNKSGDTKKDIGDFKPGKQQELQEFLELISIQRKRKDHMQWIPEIDDEIVSLDNTKELSKAINNLIKNWEIPEAGIVCQGTLDTMIRLRQLSVDPILLNLNIKSPKTQYILDYIEEYPDESIIIVSQFTSYLGHLYSMLPNSRLLVGETTTKQRSDIETEFNKGKFPIILGNIDVIKEGMKLEKAETIIFADHSLVYTDNEQVADRFIPTSKEAALKKDKQKIIRLVLKDSIDQYLFGQLAQKRSSTDIINDYSKYLNEKRS